MHLMASKRPKISMRVDEINHLSELGVNRNESQKACFLSAIEL